MRHPRDTTDDSDEPVSKTRTRRRFLSGAAATVATALAGCSSGETDTATPTDRPSRSTPTQTVTDTATRTPTESPTPTTADRISESAVPLSTATPGEGVADLQPVGDTLASAKVVGLGEATHGTREFFQLKHRILRYLVVEQGVRTFAWESGFAMSRALDDYVRRGAGDAKTALSTGGYGVWQTEAVLAMVEWLRSFNAGRPAEDKVSFYGYDAQYIFGPARRLGSYLASAEPTLPEQVRSDLDRFAENPLVLTEDTEQLQRGLNTAGSVADAVASHLDDHESAYVEESSRAEYERAQRDVWAIRRARSQLTAQRLEDDFMKSYRVRDKTMAENVAWLRAHDDADTVVVWAHNGHVKDGVFGDGHGRQGVPVMGRHLTERYGDDGYYALGADFGSGSFRARNKQTGRSDTFTVTSPDGTRPFSATMTDADPGVFVFDFSTVSDSQLRGYLRGTHKLYSAGARVDPDSVDERAASVELTESYDGILFVEETSATRPIETGGGGAD